MQYSLKWLDPRALPLLLIVFDENRKNKPEFVSSTQSSFRRFHMLC